MGEYENGAHHFRGSNVSGLFRSDQVADSEPAAAGRTLCLRNREHAARPPTHGVTAPGLSEKVGPGRITPGGTLDSLPASAGQHGVSRTANGLPGLLFSGRAAISERFQTANPFQMLLIWKQNQMCYSFAPEIPAVAKWRKDSCENWAAIGSPQ